MQHPILYVPLLRDHAVPNFVCTPNLYVPLLRDHAVPNFVSTPNLYVPLLRDHAAPNVVCIALTEGPCSTQFCMYPY